MANFTFSVSDNPKYAVAGANIAAGALVCISSGGVVVQANTANLTAAGNIWLGVATNSATVGQSITYVEGGVVLGLLGNGTNGAATVASSGALERDGAGLQVGLVDDAGNVRVGVGETVDSTGASGPASGDLLGTYPNPTVARIRGATVPPSGSLTAGHVLQVINASNYTYGVLNLASPAQFSGALEVARGGLGLNATDGANKIVTSNGTAAVLQLALDQHVADGANINGQKWNPDWGAQRMTVSGVLSLNVATPGPYPYPLSLPQGTPLWVWRNNTNGGDYDLINSINSSHLTFGSNSPAAQFLTPNYTVWRTNTLLFQSTTSVNTLTLTLDTEATARWTWAANATATLEHANTTNASGGLFTFQAQNSTSGLGAGFIFRGGNGANEAARGPVVVTGPIGGDSTEPFRYNVVSVDFASDADITLNANQYQSLIIECTNGAALTVTRNVIVPDLAAPYIFRNLTSNSKSVQVKTASGTGVTVAPNYCALVFCDATNVRQVGANASTGTSPAQLVRRVEIVTVNTAWDAPAGVSRVDGLLLGAGGGGGGGSGGGLPGGVGLGGPGGGGGGAGYPGEYIYFEGYPIVGGNTYNINIGVGGAGGTAGVGGIYGSSDPTNGTNGSNGTGTSFDMLSVNGGTYGQHGGRGVAVDGGVGGAGFSTGGAGGNTSESLPMANAGGGTLQSNVDSLFIYGSNTTSMIFDGVVIGGVAATGGAVGDGTDSLATGGRGGGGGAGASPSSIRWIPATGTTVTLQTAGDGGKGGNGAGTTNATLAGNVGGAASGTQYYGQGGCGGGGGGGAGGDINASGFANGGAGGAGGQGAHGLCVLSWYEPTGDV